MANYETELQKLKEAQKNSAIADLQKTRDTTLSNLEAEESKIKPTYEAQRSTANANNRVAARNFQEYLANTGRANSGIGAQYEMSRQNSLQNGLNAINAAEAQSVADIARRRTDAENAYNSGLAGANAQAEQNYIQNLLDQQQKQWEREFAQKQFNESVRQYNQNRQDKLYGTFSSGGGSGTSSSGNSSKKSTTSTTNAAKAVNSALGAAASLVANNNNYNSIDSQLKNLMSSGAATGVGGAMIKNSTQMKNIISNAYKNGQLTENQVYQLALKYGL